MNRKVDVIKNGAYVELKMSIPVLPYLEWCMKTIPYTRNLSVNFRNMFGDPINREFYIHLVKDENIAEYATSSYAESVAMDGVDPLDAAYVLPLGTYIDVAETWFIEHLKKCLNVYYETHELNCYVNEIRMKLFGENNSNAY